MQMIYPILMIVILETHGQNNCEWGKYGENCSKNCPSNCIPDPVRNLTHCHKETGKCSEGCVPGWFEDLCDRACSKNCLRNTCNRQNGICTFACNGDYTGDFCNITPGTTASPPRESSTYTSPTTPSESITEQKPDLAAILVPVVLILVVIAVVVIILFLYKRKRKRGETRGIIDAVTGILPCWRITDTSGTAARYSAGEKELLMAEEGEAISRIHGDADSTCSFVLLEDEDFLSGTLEQKIKDIKGVFVKTESFKKAKEKLETFGHVTLSGAPGEVAVDSTVAEALSRKVRLACFITTREVNMETKLKAVNETWGKRCDKMLYVMTTNKTGPDILGVTIPDSHRTLTEKIVHAFTHMYSTSLDEYDWFLKADDDTYVIVENLKFLLAHLNASKPVYVGDHFAPFSPNGYMGGGAGYAVSREALRRLVEQGYRVPGRCRHVGGSEDIETGRCMYKVAVSTYLSLDKYNRSTFHAANPDTFQVGVANFISGFSANKYHSGPECCSQLTVSFHYVKPELMRTLDMFLYQITVFGRTVKYKELWNLFRAEEFHIPQERRRRPYPGETIEEYYKNATEWRLKNTTIYIPDKTKPKKKTGA